MRAVCQKFFKIPKPKLTQRLIYFAFGAFFTLIFILSGGHQQLTKRFSRPLNFKVRSMLGMDPGLDPRIKVFSFGDASLAELGFSELSLKDWAGTLGSLAHSKPKAIFIDKLFGTPTGLSSLGAFKDKLARIKQEVPIVTGLFCTQQKLTKRNSLDLSRQQALNPQGQIHLSKEQPPSFCYGPSEDVAESFSAHGHIVYRGDGRLPLIFKDNQGGVVLPAAFYTHVLANRVQQPKLPPIDEEGEIVLNLSPPSDYAAQLFSLAPVIKKGRMAQGITQISSEDLVVVLPAMFTGSSDFVESPFGVIPGGYIHLALLNSFLTEHWIAPMPQPLYFLVFAAGIGVLTGLFLQGTWFWLFSSALLCLGIASSFAVFAYFGQEISWASLATVWFASALLPFVDQSRLEQLKAFGLRKDLELGRGAQALFLPQTLGGSLEGYRYRFVFRPHGPLSGDWIQAFVDPEGEKAVFALGDVVGKGQVQP